MTRRSLIQRILLILGIDGLGLPGCRPHRGVDGVSPPIEATRPAVSTSGELSRADMEDLVALGEVLAVGGTLAPAERSHLVEHLRDRTGQSVEYLALYRTAASTLQGLTGQPFGSLPLRERVELIGRHRLASSVEAPDANPAPLPPEMHALRTRVVPDLLLGYYSSPAGWAVVNYQTFPGRCGDLTRYTRAEP